LTTDTEQELVRKVDAIYTALVGLEGQEEDGLLYKSRNHELRLENLERWRWYGAGVIAAVLFYLKVTKVL
jgi:hypothetical protein